MLKPKLYKCFIFLRTNANMFMLWSGLIAYLTNRENMQNILSGKGRQWRKYSAEIIKCVE